MMLIKLFIAAIVSSAVPAGADEVSMGTTILAVRYRDGVVVGADSRTSASGYVSNRYATKISFVLEQDFGINLSPPSEIQLKSSLLPHRDGNDDEEEEHAIPKPTSTCCICRSGSAADTQYLADAIRHQLLRQKVLHYTSSSVSDVAHLTKNYLNNDSLSASVICAGYDHIQEKGIIYSIDMGGTLMEQPEWGCNGSGSGYIMGYIDEHYPKEGEPLMTEDEAVAFVGKAIELAMDRDGSSGGVVRMYAIDRHGKKSILRSPEKYSFSSVNRDAMASLSKFAPAKRSSM